MKNLPEDEKPYEKCMTGGPGSLTDSELLSVILRSGARGQNALEMAREILRGPLGGSLTGLYHTDLADLSCIHGMGRVKALQLICIAELARRIAKEGSAGRLRFSDPESVAAYYMEDLRHQEVEKVLLLMLDRKGGLIAEAEISSGTLYTAAVSPREVFLSALRHRAASVILLHNHPSGDPTPSDEDISLTARLAECGKILGIPLLDHIVIGDHSAVSFRKENMLNDNLI